MRLEKFRRVYYEGEPLISNEHYDALVAKYGEGDGLGDLGDKPHLHRMYSLTNVFDNEKIPTECQGHDLVKTPKLDGSAISLYYKDGFLVQGLTRGDGTLGTDISDKVLVMDSIPKLINMEGEVSVAGEVVTNKEAKNARNTAAGAFRLKDIAEFRERELYFVAYSIFNKDIKFVSYTDDLKYLSNQGFEVVTEIEEDKYLTDGFVYRIRNNENYELAGFTAKHPKGAYAHKNRADEDADITELLEIIWQTGASGKVTPVAIFNEVELGGAEVNRASINNVGYVERLKLDIGDSILVCRAGKVIPRIIGNVTKDIYIDV